MSLWARFPPSPCSGLWSSPKGFLGERVWGWERLSILMSFVFAFFKRLKPAMRHEKITLMVQFGKILDIQMSAFLSRAMVNSRNIKMRGDWGQSRSVFFFFQFYQVYFLWAPFHFKSYESSFFMFETFFIWIWWKINDKRGVVLQA